MKEKERFSQTKTEGVHCQEICPAGNVKRSFSGRRKAIQVRNLGLHKAEVSVEEGRNEGKIKSFAFLILYGSKFLAVVLHLCSYTLELLFVPEPSMFFESLQASGRLCALGPMAGRHKGLLRVP